MLDAGLGNFKMALPSILLLMIGCLLASSSYGISNSEFKEEPKIYKKGCTEDNECADNEYCFGRGSIGRCIECFDCATVQRKSRRKLYDGNECAKHQSDCGECNPGYMELGGVCSPTTPRISPIPDLEVKENTNRLDEEISEASIGDITMYTTVGIIIIIVLLLASRGGVKLFQRKRQGHSSARDEEATGLCNSPFCNTPTAPPPEEYRPQPSTYFPFLEFGGQDIPQRIVSKNVTALPFDAGNGAGNWIVDPGSVPIQATPQMNHYAANNNDDPPLDDDSSDEEVDGNNEQSVENNVTNNIHPIENNAAIPESSSSGVQADPNQQQHSQGFDGFPQVPDFNDPLVGRFRFSFHMEAQFARLETGGNSSQSQAVPYPSAPVSPGRIDDTHVYHDWSVFQNASFIASRVSLDSGTGTGDDRSVPSRSVSGGDVRQYSDNDESLYDQSPIEESEVPENINMDPADYEEMELDENEEE